MPDIDTDLRHIDPVLRHIDAAHTWMDSGRLDRAALHIPLAARAYGLERGLAGPGCGMRRPLLSLAADLEDVCDRHYDLLWDQCRALADRSM